MEKQKFSPENFMAYLQRLAIIVRLGHWRTTSYPTHVVLGELYSILDNSIDSVVENYQGHAEVLLNITIPEAVNIPDLVPVLKESAKYIQKQKESFPGDIQNILDEITGAINKTIYKLRLLK